MFLVCSTSCACASKSIQNQSKNPFEIEPKSSENRSRTDQKPIKESLSRLTSVFWNLGSVFSSILGAKIDQKSIGHGLQEVLEATLASAPPPESLRWFSWDFQGFPKPRFWAQKPPPEELFDDESLRQSEVFRQSFSLTRVLCDNRSLCVNRSLWRDISMTRNHCGKVSL